MIFLIHGKFFSGSSQSFMAGDEFFSSNQFLLSPAKFFVKFSKPPHILKSLSSFLDLARFLTVAGEIFSGFCDILAPDKNFYIFGELSGI